MALFNSAVVSFTTFFRCGRGCRKRERVVGISDATKSVLLHYRFVFVLFCCRGCICHGVKRKERHHHGNIAFELLHSFKDLQLGGLDAAQAAKVSGPLFAA